MLMGWKAVVNPDIRRRVNRVRIAKLFHWTLAEVDTLSMQDYNDIYGVIDAENKKAEIDQQKAQARSRAKGKKR